MSPFSTGFSVAGTRMKPPAFSSWSISDSTSRRKVSSPAQRSPDPAGHGPRI
ncbi:MAG: hypothetical protein ABI759_14770 [Candidatus Solibacter sp.]